MKFEFQFGKVTYKQGAPKNLPRWVWRCACGNCSGNMSGPFKTRRAAEKDAEAFAMAIVESADSVHH
jgi:hypothetical protein